MRLKPENTLKLPRRIKMVLKSVRKVVLFMSQAILPCRETNSGAVSTCTTTIVTAE
jgi:hypothetical protein